VRSPSQRRGFPEEPPDRDTPLTGEIVGGVPRRPALPSGRHGVSEDDDYNVDHLREPDPGRSWDEAPTRAAGRGGSGSWAYSPPSAGTPGERRAGPAPSWQARISPSRPAVVRPGPAVPIIATAAAGLAWLLVVAYGFDHLPLLWTLAAFLAGGGGLALTIRGYPVPGAIALVAAVVGWGLATRDLVPQSAIDILGDLRLFGWNLAFAAPLLPAYLGALRIDARRSAQAEVRSMVEKRRWWGDEAGGHRGHGEQSGHGERGGHGEPEPRLGVLEAIPSVRFFAVPGKICTHLVVAGRQVAVVGSTVWPRGDYTNDQADVLRNGRFFGPGSDDVTALMTDSRTWVRRFTETPVTCRAFLVVHPASERSTDEVRLALPRTEHAELVHADAFAEVVGELLMREPYRIDVQVIQMLVEQLGERDAPQPESSPASAGRAPRMAQ
jgi:hypothetical protein